jgi:uncharacterized protein (DUF362 family)
MRTNLVAASLGALKGYPVTLPFHPPEAYPELAGVTVDRTNQVYSEFRDLLRRLGMHTQAFGSAAWNPFGELVRPGMTVFIKPNTVMHRHERGKDVFSVLVHASVLRPILDYVCIALKESGRIVVGDSQLLFSDFDKAMQVSGIADLLIWYRTKTRIPIDLLDLRQARSARSWLYGKWRRLPIEGDPQGYCRVELDKDSLFHGIDPASLRIAVASYREMQQYHCQGRHAYLMPRSLLGSDVVINIAKLKTHRRTGVTLALKNFMGLPSAKGALPHFRIGSPEEGGDQYVHPSARKRLATRMHDFVQTSRWTPLKFVVAVAKRLLWDSRFIVPFPDEVFEAMWPGNDTVWRTLMDIHRAVLYADKNGCMQSTPQRSTFHLIDGIVGGQGDGPLSPDPVSAGCMLAGLDPVSLDVVAAGLMGFDHNRIRLLREGLRERDRELPISTSREEDIRVSVGESLQTLPEFLASYNLHFAPHPSWKGSIERA